MAGQGALLRRALQQAELRYGPQQQELQALLADRGSQRDDEIAGNNAGSQLLAAAIREAAPKMTGAYDQALSTVQAQQQAVQGMPGASLSAEQTASFARRIGEQRANVAADAEQQGVRAAQDAVYSNRQANTSYKTDVAKIAQQLLGLGDQSGLYTATTLGDLQDTRTKNQITKRGQDVTAQNAITSAAQSERSSVRSSGIDPDTGQPIPGGKLDPKAAKKPKLSQDKHLETQDKISQAVAALGTLDPDKQERREAASLLVAGAKSQPLYDPKTGKKRVSQSGTALSTPDIPGVGGLLASAASDVYYDGHLSRRNQKRLRAAGFKLGELGFPTYAQWKRQQASKPAVKPPVFAGAQVGGTAAVSGG